MQLLVANVKNKSDLPKFSMKLAQNVLSNGKPKFVFCLILQFNIALPIDLTGRLPPIGFNAFKLSPWFPKYLL